MKRFTDVYVEEKTLVPSDHYPIIAKVKILGRTKGQGRAKKKGGAPTDWEALCKNPVMKKAWNTALETELAGIDPLANDVISTGLDAVAKVSFEHIPRKKRTTKAWFAAASLTLLPLLKTRDYA